MTAQTPAIAEMEKWFRIWVRFFTNFWLRSGSEGKTQNPAGVDSGNPDLVPPLTETQMQYNKVDFYAGL